MSKLAQRLDRLEKAAKKHRVGVCKLCYGHPIAAIQVMHEPDPNGPGFRKTGEGYLLEHDSDRIGDDLCCRRCGAPATQIHLITGDHGQKPKGRRVWLD